MIGLVYKSNLSIQTRYSLDVYTGYNVRYVLTIFF